MVNTKAPLHPDKLQIHKGENFTCEIKFLNKRCEYFYLMLFIKKTGKDTMYIYVYITMLYISLNHTFSLYAIYLNNLNKFFLRVIEYSINYNK